MARRPLFTFGDELSLSESAKVIKVLAPNRKRGTKRRPVHTVLGALHELMPHRLDHEVNRLRGWAFDSGEAGFSHIVIE